MNETKIMRKKKRALVDQSLCVACAKVCPLGAIEIWKGITARVSDRCVGCGRCAAECPASVITIREVENL